MVLWPENQNCFCAVHIYHILYSIYNNHLIWTYRHLLKFFCCRSERGGLNSSVSIEVVVGNNLRSSPIFQYKVMKYTWCPSFDGKVSKVWLLAKVNKIVHVHLQPIIEIEGLNTLQNLTFTPCWFSHIGCPSFDGKVSKGWWYSPK